jgi:hypothetical protein
MAQQIIRTTTETSDPLRSPAILNPAPTTGVPANGIGPTQTGDESVVDKGLRWAKELMAALIGIALVACLVAMLWRSFDFLGRDQTDLSFQRVKDLLLFINPLVGVVIGYYFNRVSTEARAESAERMAQGATLSAQQSESARAGAEAEAASKKAESEEAKSVLQDMIPAAETVLSQIPPPAPTVLGQAGTAAMDTLAEMRLNLQRSLERARAFTERRSA